MTNSNRENNMPATDLDNGFGLIDYFLVILKRKIMVFWIVASTIIVSTAVSLMMPKMYTATARIFPPLESGSSVSVLLSQAGGGLGSLANRIVGSKTPSELYAGILQSRTIADNLIETFDLKKIYEIKYLADAYQKLANRTYINVSRKDQIVSVSVEDRDPQRAADMANAYVQLLDQINRNVNVTEGHRKRIFLENRLNKAKEDLTKSESILKDFQEKYKLVAIEEQARVTIEAAAKLKAEIITAQTELKVLKQFGTEKQNEAVMLKSKINELLRQLDKIERGSLKKDSLSNNKTIKENTNFYIPFNQLPSLGMEWVRLIREAKIQEKIFELLTNQYELAKIEEAKDLNTIQVLDQAVSPDKKSSPMRTRFVITATFVSFFLSVILAFLLQYLDHLKAEESKRFQELVDNIKFRKAQK